MRTPLEHCSSAWLHLAQIQCNVRGAFLCIVPAQVSKATAVHDIALPNRYLMAKRMAINGLDYIMAINSTPGSCLVSLD